jgi:hypothetical protein
MSGRRPATAVGCRWCGRRLDEAHAAGDCLQHLDRDLEASIDAKQRRERSIEVRLRALDGYMDKTPTRNTR